MAPPAAACRLRWAVPADAGEIVAMIRELAVFEREPASSVEIDEADILRDAFGTPRRCEVVLAEMAVGDGAAWRVAGFALFFHNYSTWTGRAGLYLEDIFLRDFARGSGCGRTLMAGLAKIALARGCPRFDLWVLHWNPARTFYEKLGFVDMADWRPYRLSGAKLGQLAEEAPDGFEDRGS